MGLFDWLLVGHVIGDFILQTSWMQRKTQEWFPLLVHAMVYTIAVTAMSFLSNGKGLSWLGILVIFGSHVILDHRKFIHFWAEKVTGASQIEWLKITLDQAWHIVILGMVTLL